MEVFHRTPLAEELATFILDDLPSSSSSSLLLAAPRGTGKSTFLSYDLGPALSRRGAVVIHVDLWASRGDEPGELIAAEIRCALARHEGALIRLARRTGLVERGNGLSPLSLLRDDVGHMVSVTHALAALSDECERILVLIVDEAQDVITTKNGKNILRAIRSAIEELNMGSHHGLRVVAVGSEHDKLTMLAQKLKPSFNDESVRDFPLLGREFVEWFCRHAPVSVRLNVDQVEELFRRYGCRPAWLGAGLDALQQGTVRDPSEAVGVMTSAMIDHERNAVQHLLRRLRWLDPLEFALLRVIAAQGRECAPRWPGTINTLQTVLAEDGNPATMRVDVAHVSAALETLREKELLWRSAEGLYALEDIAMRDMLKNAGLLSAATRQVTPLFAVTD
nr:ATP-binding protein [uncultured Roseateles sp.]